jgi:ABC-type polysaccharide/polyol phosphate transport system ATPase subunit
LEQVNQILSVENIYLNGAILGMTKKESTLKLDENNRF